MRFPLARRRSRRRRARRDRTPRRGRSLQETRGSSVARVGGTHRAAVGRSKRPSGAHVVGARGEMPGRDASRGERVRETREERDGASVRGGSVRAARRAHGTSRAVECGKRAVMGSFKRDFLVSRAVAARCSRSKFSTATFGLLCAFREACSRRPERSVRVARGSVARALRRRLHAHTRRCPRRRRRSTRAHSDALPHSASAPARSRRSSPERSLRHDLHGRRGSRRGGGRRARPRGREIRRRGRRLRQGQGQQGRGRAHQGGPEAGSAAAPQARPPRPRQGGGGAARRVRREAGAHRGTEARHRDAPGRAQDRRRGIREHEDQDPGAQPAVSGAHGTWFAHPDRGRVRRSRRHFTKRHPAASAARDRDLVFPTFPTATAKTSACRKEKHKKTESRVLFSSLASDSSDSSDRVYPKHLFITPV